MSDDYPTKYGPRLVPAGVGGMDDDAIDRASRERDLRQSSRLMPHDIVRSLDKYSWGNIAEAQMLRDLEALLETPHGKKDFCANRMYILGVINVLRHSRRKKTKAAAQAIWESFSPEDCQAFASGEADLEIPDC